MASASPRWEQTVSVTQRFAIPPRVPLNAVLSIAQAFNRDGTLLIPLQETTARDELPVDNIAYDAMGGYYVYLHEEHIQDEPSEWHVRRIAVAPQGEDPAIFRDRMIELARLAAQSAIIDHGVEPARLPNTATIEGLASLAGASVIGDTLYLAGVSEVRATDGSAVVGVLHVPKSYGMYVPGDSETWQASAGYLAARIMAPQ